MTKLTVIDARCCSTVDKGAGSILVLAVWPILPFVPSLLTPAMAADVRIPPSGMPAGLTPSGRLVGTAGRVAARFVPRNVAGTIED